MLLGVHKYANMFQKADPNPVQRFLTNSTFGCIAIEVSINLFILTKFYQATAKSQMGRTGFWSRFSCLCTPMF